MSNDLREQLLKAGLVTEEQVRKAETASQQKGRGRRGRSRSKAPAAAAKGSEAEQAHRRKVERDRALNRERDAELARRSLKAQVRELVLGNARNDPRGDIKHHYVVGGQVRQVYVNAEQHRALADGRLAIAVLYNRSHVIPVEAARKLERLDPDAVVVVASEEPQPDENDPYADRPVPDDLMW
jgi:uncharacterized protein YaiL (DUF2058 family)